MNQILFFGVREDILPMLQLVENGPPLKYARMGNFLRDEVGNRLDVFNFGEEIPNLGMATAESAIACESFLVCDKGTPINLEAVGTERICVDQLDNPDTVTFTPGGILNKDIVLHGRIATVSESPASQALMKRFQGAIKRTFSKVKAFHVGPKALALLQCGTRLTISAQSPREFDLKQ